MLAVRKDVIPAGRAADGTFVEPGSTADGNIFFAIFYLGIAAPFPDISAHVV